MLDQMDAKESLEKLYTLIRDAEEKKSSGDFRGACLAYTEAAKSLMNLAEYSQGELRTSRLENAEHLIHMAEVMKKRMLPEQAAPVNRLEHMKAGRKDSSDYPQTFEELGVIVYNVPNISFNEVAGLEDVKDEILTKVIYPMRNRNLAKEYKVSPGGGVLLYGPPGTGKTYIARAISHEVSAKFVIINPSSLLSQWFGVFEKKIEQLFRLARENAPTVLFFDEIDALAPRRGKTNSSVMKRAVPQLLAEMDGFSRDPENMVLVLGATNNPWDMEEALMRPGRFDEKIYVRLPGKDARRKMFELSLKGRRIAQDIDYEKLSALSESYSGAEIDYICRKAAEEVFKDSVEKGIARDIDEVKIEDVMGRTSKSVNSEMLRRYEDFTGNR